MVQRKRSLIVCVSCGSQAFRGSPRAKYCISCSPYIREFVPATNCVHCNADITHRHYLATTCFDCSGRSRPGYRYKPMNDNEIARKITKYAVKHGFLLPAKSYICIDCKSRQAECYDHRDYTRPLDVEAVCLPCNASRGRGIPLYLVGSKAA